MTASGMSLRELLNLPVAATLDESNRALRLGRANGYAMAKTGGYPVPVLRLGRAYRVKRSDLLSYLGIADHEAAPERAEPAPLAALKPGGFEPKERPLLRSVN